MCNECAIMSVMDNEIKKLRKRLKLNQAEFAVKIGVAEYTVRRWESGRSKPSRMARKAVEEVFGVILDTYR